MVVEAGGRGRLWEAEGGREEEEEEGAGAGAGAGGEVEEVDGGVRGVVAEGVRWSVAGS